MSASRKNRLRMTAQAFLAVIALLVVAGILYEQIGRHRDRKRYPQIGQSIDIGGRALNLFCSGAGSPTVILESGGHTAGYAWIDIQPEIAKFTRACWYDRAAYGWSDPGPQPRTFRATAADLHALLRAAKIDPPYVLVGATESGFRVRIYNGLHPDDVAGAVLIHASEPEVLDHEPAYMKSKFSSLPSALQRFSCNVLKPVLLNLGILRLMGNPGSGRPYGIDLLTLDQQAELNFLSNNPETARGGSGCSLDEDMQEVRASGAFGDKPLAILTTSAPPLLPPPNVPPDQATTDSNNFWFHQVQPHLATLSSRGQLIISADAEQPDSIVRAVRTVVDQARADASSPH